MPGSDLNRGRPFPESRVEVYGRAAPALVSSVAPERSLPGYVNLLSARKRWLLAGTSGLGAALLLTVIQKPLYEARGTIEILGRNENFLFTKELDPTPTPGEANSDSYLATQVKLLQSEELAGRVWDKVNQASHPAPDADASASASAPFWFDFSWNSGAPHPCTRDALVDQAVKNLSVRSTGVSRILEKYRNQMANLDEIVAAYAQRPTPAMPHFRFFIVH